MTTKSRTHKHTLCIAYDQQLQFYTGSVLDMIVPGLIWKYINVGALVPGILMGVLRIYI